MSYAGLQAGAWDLPPDYPMTAPNYAERRSKLAKEIGLGHRPDAEASPNTRMRSHAGAEPDQDEV